MASVINWMIRVAWPMQRGKTPVAMGSSVPAWPIRFSRVRLLSQATTLKEVIPSGLLMLRIPLMNSLAFGAI